MNIWRSEVWITWNHNQNPGISSRFFDKSELSAYFRNILFLFPVCISELLEDVSVSMPPSGHTYSGSSGYDRIKSEYGSRWILYEIAPVSICRRLSSSTPPTGIPVQAGNHEVGLWIDDFPNFKEMDA